MPAFLVIFYLIAIGLVYHYWVILAFVMLFYLPYTVDRFALYLWGTFALITLHTNPVLIVIAGLLAALDLYHDFQKKEVAK